LVADAESEDSEELDEEDDGSAAFCRRLTLAGDLLSLLKETWETFMALSSLFSLSEPSSMMENVVGMNFFKR